MLVLPLMFSSKRQITRVSPVSDIKKRGTKKYQSSLMNVHNACMPVPRWNGRPNIAKRMEAGPAPGASLTVQGGAGDFQRKRVVASRQRNSTVHLCFGR